ncbi:MAG: hypothetical protein LBU72_05805 [Burkholderiaceae bacterium]|nr:hypothetical protein [Burkholderiaceae bacterium]
MGLTPALAYFRGQSVYSFQLYSRYANIFPVANGWDSRQYTDLNALCADAVASFTQTTGWAAVLESTTDNTLPACQIKYQWTNGQWFEMGIDYKAVNSTCPANSFSYVSVYENTLCYCYAPYIESGNACVAPPRPVVIGFFNGVWNTRNQAPAGLNALQELIGPQYAGQDLQYQIFYNQTGTGDGNTALQTWPRSSSSAARNSTACSPTAGSTSGICWRAGKPPRATPSPPACSTGWAMARRR